MTKEECFSLGYISRKVGNNGELAFTLDVDDPSRYKKLDTVFVERNNSLVPFFIKSFHLKGIIATVKLEGIDTISAAEELVKSGLFLPLTYLPALTGKHFYFHELPGYEVIDAEYGAIGTVREVLNFPQQAIVAIMKGKQEILIPAKDDFIERIDRDKKILYLNAPPGLIDIYLNLGNKEDEIEEDLDEPPQT